LNAFLFSILLKLVLTPARARLEAMTVDTIELKSDEAFEIALANRLDFMNGRRSWIVGD